MKKKIIQIGPLSLVLLFIFLKFQFSFAAYNHETVPNQKQDYTISSWLVLGPHPFHYPAFSKEERNGFKINNLIQLEDFDTTSLLPRETKTFRWNDGSTVAWKKISCREGNVELPIQHDLPSSAYLASYIDVKRWTQGILSIQSPQVFQVFLDGKSILTKDKIDIELENSTSSKTKKTTTTIALETGKHLIIIKSLTDPDLNSTWTMKVSLSIEDRLNNSPPEFSLTPTRNMNIADLLDSPKIDSVSISADGELAAVSLRQSLTPSDDYESWIEMYRVSDGTLFQTFRGRLSLNRINWAPSGKKFSYTTQKESRSTLWIVDIDAGTNLPLLKNVESMGPHVWSPSGLSIFYYVRESGEKDLPGVKRLQTLEDRQPFWRDRNFLYQVKVPEGVTRRLTAGEFSTSLNSISPDGTKLLFTRIRPEYSLRPYSKTQLFVLDIDTLSPKLIWEGSFLRSAQWNPDGDKLLITGGPSTFGSLGVNLKKNLIPNDYDIQAYLFDLETEKVVPLSLKFKPSIEEAYWNKTDSCIYFISINKTFRQLYRYNLENRIYIPITTGVEYIDNFKIAEKSSVAVYSGSSANIPQKVYILDLKSLKYRELADPNKKDFADVRFGEVKSWNFKNNQGHEIEGRVYYPPDFNPNNKYPCIVYYYGGTTPVTREFGGRYPKNLYAAQGYIVYVLQPSGTIGYGQDFSALHVNDWGAIVTDDIMKGVKEFLEDHPFVDPKRVGCMGASYGGFMTMLLLTRTNMFTAAISHAGISSIASYWGEGYWGYSYSAVAAADSFPWSRKDIFINQSPLFNADKITTPLLLLHGSADTNVPPGESTQLFTALKLLGREVEYIQFADQNHHILTYGKRILWTKTIMAWFDYWLKSEPEWWSSLYPKK